MSGILYFIEARFHTGCAFVERASNDMTYAETLRDIATGQVSDVVRVIEVNPTEFSSRDISEDLALDIIRNLSRDGDPVRPFLRPFLETHAPDALAEYEAENDPETTEWRSDRQEHSVEAV